MLTTGGRDIDWILRRMAVGSVQLAQRRPAILNIPGIFGEREGMKQRASTRVW
jgi:hypothetical protein